VVPAVDIDRIAGEETRSATPALPFLPFQ